MNRRVFYVNPGDATVHARHVDGLSDLQQLVGGYIEQVPVFDDFTVWVNEEGKLRDLTPNVRWPQAGDVLCGVVVFDGGIDDEGDTLEITAEQLTRATAFFKKNRI